MGVAISCHGSVIPAFSRLCYSWHFISLENLPYFLFVGLNFVIKSLYLSVPLQLGLLSSVISLEILVACQG